jgi:hypothetical protein
VVRIDRGFAAQPPVCIQTLTPFRYEQGSKWIQALADGTGSIAEREACFAAVQDWIASERAARMTATELTQ